MNQPGAESIQALMSEWRAHLGRSRSIGQMLDVESLRRFAVAVGADPDVERSQPPLAHWAYFLETVPHEGLGSDGHARRGGDLLPAINLQRRMFAATEVRFAAPLALNQPAELVITVTDIKHRSGRSGDLVLLELSRRLSQHGHEKLVEQQTLVYRAGGDPVAPVIATQPSGQSDAITWQPDTVELFRFSAATFNAHRIHYDAHYAREQEHYPDLIVHGPLVAARLFAVAQAHSRAPLEYFSYRGNAPLFVNQPIQLRRTADESGFEAVRCDGVIAATAIARAQL